MAVGRGRGSGACERARRLQQAGARDDGRESRQGGGACARRNAARARATGRVGKRAQAARPLPLSVALRSKVRLRYATPGGEWSDVKSDGVKDECGREHSLTVSGLRFWEFRANVGEELGSLGSAARDEGDQKSRGQSSDGVEGPWTWSSAFYRQAGV